MSTIDGFAETQAVLGWVGKDAFENLQQIRILVVGAGGLGCEILKNLAESGFQQIHVVDMDTIDLTNLNRQFLFRDSDIGKYKAIVAAEKISQSVSSNISITGHVNKIQEMPDSFYESFHIVVCGLDNVEARRWINAKLVDLCRSDPSPEGLRPLIDGGSEGFRGQCRVILPTITACYECTLSLLLSDAASNYPLCTVASVPRLPEHCIQWALAVKWPQVFNASRKPDFDHVEDMQWLFEQAKERATSFNISGVTLELVYGVLKRIIPAVASTNAVIAASCSLEALKLASGKYSPIDNYFMYAGDSGIFTSVFKFEKSADCLVCGDNFTSYNSKSNSTLKQFLEQVMKSHNLHDIADPANSSNKNDTIYEDEELPSITTAEGVVLYMAHPVALRKQTSSNLTKLLEDLISKNGTEVAITHKRLPVPLRCVVTLDK